MQPVILGPLLMYTTHTLLLCIPGMVCVICWTLTFTRPDVSGQEKLCVNFRTVRRVTRKHSVPLGRTVPLLVSLCVKKLVLKGLTKGFQVLNKIFP